MKHRLQITLEDTANELLNQQENKSKFIEDLILKQDASDLTTEIKRLAMLVDGQIGDIQTIMETVSLVKQKLNGLSSNGRTADFDSANLGSRPSEPARSKADILLDIRMTEDKYAKEAEYCQDPETLEALKNACANEVALLWKEYKELDNA